MTSIRLSTMIVVVLSVVQYVMPISITHEAAAWRTEYFLESNQFSLEDLTIIANLCYFSFLRSHNTCSVQQAGVKALDATRQLWHNVTKMRRNPSNKPPYDIDDQIVCQELAEFCNAYTQYARTNKQYAQVVETVVHGTLVNTKVTMNAINDMRERSRALVAQAIANTGHKRSGNNTSKTFLEMLKEQGGVLYDLGARVVHGFWQLAPGFALSTFVDTDREYNKISEHAWDLLMQFEGTGVALWESIECTRAQFYQACYRTVFAYYQAQAKRMGSDASLYILFDEHGELLHEPCELLPCLDTLKID